MKAHVFRFPYALQAFVIFSSLLLIVGDIKSLVPEGKTFRSTFRPLNKSVTEGEWVFLEVDLQKQSYHACQSREWLVSVKQFNTTAMQELTMEVVFRHYLNGKPQAVIWNKTSFIIGLFTQDKLISQLKSQGELDKTSQRLTSTQLVAVNGYQDLRIGIQPPDQQDCLILFSVKIFYRYCPEQMFRGLTQFPRMYAPKNGSIPLKVKGRCNYSLYKPVAFCDSEGNWQLNDTISYCNCGPYKIMSSQGCVGLKSLIRKPKAVRLSNSQAVFSWEYVFVSQVSYVVTCKKCDSEGCDADCSDAVVGRGVTTPGRNVTYVKELEKGRRYVFMVTAKVNDVNTSLNDKYWNETTKKVLLRELPEEVRNLAVASRDHDQITLRWLPSPNSHVINVSYEVKCQPLCVDESCGREDCAELNFIRGDFVGTNITISRFQNDGQTYRFQVFAKDPAYLSLDDGDRIQWNSVSLNFTADFKVKIFTKQEDSLNVVDIVIGVSVVILAVIITVVVTRCYNRWRRRKHTLNFHAQNPDDAMECRVSLTDLTKHYVDPSDYDSIENVLKKFTTKLNEKNLKTEAIIGEGEFGVVWKGYLEIPGKEVIVVAVKSLRSGLSDKLRHDFLAEASLMGQFKDPNVISLHGVVVKRRTVKIVMEYMSNGSLDQYLMKNVGRLTTLQLLGMARGIASGMKYLSGRNFIHRDLAARNILINENLSCKVSDFGLTREICETSNYETRGGKIPIRWTAPEVIKHKKSFIASDVWSYGVVLWEIMSFGQRPYWEWDNFQVLQEVESGYRLPAPPNCPKTVHNLMLHCWERDRVNRPTFLHILDKIDEWIRSPETVHHSPATRLKRKSIEIYESQSPIRNWLDSIKMGKYAANFSKAGIHRLSQVVSLTEQDLADMGITLVGHRHKIHQSIPLVT